ncbi:histidinol-phosphate transaminase [Lachnospiraceae bacterium 62-35]
MAPYLHGGDIYSQEIHMDYSVNISPLGLPDGVKKAVRDSLDEFCTYPDSSCRSLRQALSVFHGIKKEEIICGNGAADLIFQLVQAVKPKKALVTAPSFQEYEQALAAVGAEAVRCCLRKEDDFQPDMERWLSLADTSVEMAFICNPNNPTGQALKSAEVVWMAEICRKKGILLVVDECFNEFLEEPEEYSVIPYINQYDNLFILRAFTKIYAMAGFRLGYGISSRQTLFQKMEGQRQPWSVSGIAQKAGEAALKEEKYVLRVRKLVLEERGFLEKGLKTCSFSVYPSMANYLLFYAPGDGEGEESLYEKMKRRKILLRSCNNYQGLGQGYYRICIRDRKSNEKLLAALAEEYQPFKDKDRSKLDGKGEKGL